MKIPNDVRVGAAVVKGWLSLHPQGANPELLADILDRLTRGEAGEVQVGQMELPYFDPDPYGYGYNDALVDTCDPT